MQAVAGPDLHSSPSAETIYRYTYVPGIFSIYMCVHPGVVDMPARLAQSVQPRAGLALEQPFHLCKPAAVHRMAVGRKEERARWGGVKTGDGDGDDDDDDDNDTSGRTTGPDRLTRTTDDGKYFVGQYHCTAAVASIETLPPRAGRSSRR